MVSRIKIYACQGVLILLILSCSERGPTQSEPTPPPTKENPDPTTQEIQPDKTEAVSGATEGYLPTDSVAPENTFIDEHGNIIYVVVDEKPQFPGGEPAWENYLKTAIKYPSSALQKQAEGTVHVTFVVGKDGTIWHVELGRGLDEPSLNREAMRVISAMPNWIPGKQNGKPVDVKYTLPVHFHLEQ